MKALLVAAALALPIAANAENTKTSVPAQPPAEQKANPEAGTPDQSGTLSGSQSGSAIGSEEMFSAQRAVDKLHHVNQKNIEYGNLAKTRGSNTQVRKFGEKLAKDHKGLEDQVASYAKANHLQLGEAEKELQGSSQPGTGGDPANAMTTAGSKQGSTGTTSGTSSTYGTASDSMAQAGRNDGLGTTGESGAMGSESDLNGTGGSTSRANDVGKAPVDSQQAMGAQQTPEQKHQEFQAKLDELKNLQGPEFDAQFLSNVVESSERSLTKLQGWKGQGDKKLNTLLDRAIKVIGDHQKDAQKLQQVVPAA